MIPHRPIVLTEPQWRAREAAHHERIDACVVPHLERRKHGIAHPVWDFLFDYYSLSPAKLRAWHPGVGVHLTGDVSAFSSTRGYTTARGVVEVDATQLDVPLLDSTLELLEATRSRPGSFGCFGRHEWAMVYRQSPDQIRHSHQRLRLTQDEIAAVVESTPLRCTHFDAFRFYTDAARPLNTIQPTRATQVDYEQPGCLHATMDLYKWAYRTYPAVGSDLLAQCFTLACDVREIDMRAAPYDLAELGFPAIRIETSDGRAEYVEHQRAFTERGQLLREELITTLRLAKHLATTDAPLPLHLAHQ